MFWAPCACPGEPEQFGIQMRFGAHRVFFSIHFGHCEMCINLKKESEVRLSHGFSVLKEKADFALLQKAGKRFPYNASAGSLHLYPTWKWMGEMQAAAPRHP